MRAIGYLLGFGFILLGMLLGGKWAHFVDYPSIAIVGGISVGFALPTHGANVWRAMVGILVDTDVNAAQADDIVDTLQTLRRIALAAGWVTLLVGCVNMARSGDPNDLSWFGPAFGVAILPLLYSAILSELLIRPAITRWRKRFAMR